jgi:hypothetical protein
VARKTVDINNPVVKAALDGCQKKSKERKKAMRQSAAQVQLLADLAAYELENSIPVVSLFGWSVPVSSRWTWEHVIKPVAGRQ